MLYDRNGCRRRELLYGDQNYFIPGYTGHCPTLRFQFGKCYGACTRDIIQTLAKNGMIRQSCQPSMSPSLQPQEVKTCSHPKYILGYTGYIPGMCRNYGKSFHQIVRQCKK